VPDFQQLQQRLLTLALRRGSIRGIGESGADIAADPPAATII
jgi:hypothetical protein